jgi:hypothetical protein
MGRLLRPEARAVNPRCSADIRSLVTDAGRGADATSRHAQETLSGGRHERTSIAVWRVNLVLQARSRAVFDEIRDVRGDGAARQRGVFLGDSGRDVLPPGGRKTERKAFDDSSDSGFR